MEQGDCVFFCYYLCRSELPKPGPWEAISLVSLVIQLAHDTSSPSLLRADCVPPPFVSIERPAPLCMMCCPPV